jgi:hypothetical protein
VLNPIVGSVAGNVIVNTNFCASQINILAENPLFGAAVPKHADSWAPAQQCDRPVEIARDEPDLIKAIEHGWHRAASSSDLESAVHGNGLTIDVAAGR